MIQNLLKDSAVYGLSTVLSRGVVLLLLPLYTRVLAPADLGILEILTIYAALISLTIALEISQGVARFFPDAETAQAKISYASTALWFTIAAYTAVAVFSSLSSTALTRWLLGSEAYEGVFRIAVLSIWASGIFYVAQNQLRWELKPTLYAIASLVLTLVSTSLAVILLLGPRLGIIGVFYGQLVGTLIGAALALFFARHSYVLVFDWTKCKEMLGFSIPLVPSSIGVFVTLYIDRIAIREIMSISDVGLFGVAYRVASVVGLVMVGFQGSLTPLIYTHYRNPNTPYDLARIFRYFVAFALLVVLGLAVYSRELLTILTTPNYYAASTVVPLLVPAVLLSGMYIFAPGLAIAKKTGVIAAINITGAVLNMALNFALVPILGIQGAALATLFSAAAIFCAYMTHSQKLYFVPHSWLRLGTSVLVTVGMFVVGAQINLSFWLDMIAKSAIICGTAGIFILLRLIEIGEIQELYFRLRLLAGART